MLTFKKFLTEDTQQILYTDSTWNSTALNDVIKMIKRDCDQYLKEIKDPMKVRAYRGIQVYRPQPLVIKKYVRTNRHPVDTPNNISKLMDNWFNKKFGIKFRSEALFVTGNVIAAKHFGYVYIVFPIGNYDYSWSPVYSDLTDDFANALSKKIKQYPEEYKYLNDRFINIKKNHLEEFMEDGKYIFNEDLVKGLKRSEVMIKSKSYYAISTLWTDVYSEILSKLNNT